jgi:hypothetical protein
MGILDDAIREHLELKRKHGVPEEEVERQQEEALGPARREVAQQPENGDIAADAVDDASLFDGEERDAPVAEAPAVVDDQTAIAEPPAELAEPPAEAPPAEPFSEESPEAEPPVADHMGMEPPPAEPDLAEPEPPEPDPHDALGDTEPHGFPALEDDDLHEEPALEDESDGDPLPASDAEDEELDVLEDTPDFLQETPEHDRLWFEQKPPRDFDFD